MLTGILFRIIINVSMLAILGLIYYLFRRKMVYLVSAVLIAMTTFILVFVLGKNEFGIATGIGLFAIFGIIRYRTEQVPIIEMTYIFISITISVVNAIADELLVPLTSSVLLNSSMIFVTAILFYLNQKNEIGEVELMLDTISWLEFDEKEKILFLSRKAFKTVKSYRLISIDHLRETSRVIVYFKK